MGVKQGNKKSPVIVSRGPEAKVTKPVGTPLLAPLPPPESPLAYLADLPAEKLILPGGMPLAETPARLQVTEGEGGMAVQPATPAPGRSYPTLGSLQSLPDQPEYLAPIPISGRNPEEEKKNRDDAVKAAQYLPLLTLLAGGDSGFGARIAPQFLYSALKGADEGNDERFAEGVKLTTLQNDLRETQNRQLQQGYSNEAARVNAANRNAVDVYEANVRSYDNAERLEAKAQQAKEAAEAKALAQDEARRVREGKAAVDAIDNEISELLKTLRGQALQPEKVKAVARLQELKRATGRGMDFDYEDPNKVAANFPNITPYQQQQLGNWQTGFDERVRQNNIRQGNAQRRLANMDARLKLAQDAAKARTAKIPRSSIPNRLLTLNKEITKWRSEIFQIQNDPEMIDPSTGQWYAMDEIDRANAANAQDKMEMYQSLIDQNQEEVNRLTAEYQSTKPKYVDTKSTGQRFQESYAPPTNASPSYGSTKRKAQVGQPNPTKTPIGSGKRGASVPAQAKAALSSDPGYNAWLERGRKLGVPVGK